MNRFLFLVVFLALFLSACDPFKADQIEAQANADATKVLTEQQARDLELQREHREELNRIEQLKAMLRYEQIVAIWKHNRQTLMIVVQLYIIGLAAGGAVILVFLGHHGVVEGKRLITGFTTAAIQFAELRANRLPINPETGQFDAVRYIGENIVAVMDINTGMVRLMDQRSEPDAQLAAGAIAIRHTGVATRNTRLAKKDVADFVPAAAQPPIIEGRAFDIESPALGDFFRTMLNRDIVKEDADHDDQ